MPWALSPNVRASLGRRVIQRRYGCTPRSYGGLPWRRPRGRKSMSRVRAFTTLAAPIGSRSFAVLVPTRNSQSCGCFKASFSSAATASRMVASVSSGGIRGGRRRGWLKGCPSFSGALASKPSGCPVLLNWRSVPPAPALHALSHQTPVLSPPFGATPSEPRACRPPRPQFPPRLAL